MNENDPISDQTAPGNTAPDAEHFARENPVYVDEEFLDTFAKGLMDLNEQLSNKFQANE